MDYIDIIEKNIYNIDSKICGIIDDYKVLQDSQKVADYVIQFLRTYLEHIAAHIYAHENPNEEVPIRGKDKWYTKYMKSLKESNDGKTIVIVSHRPSTMNIADSILNVEKTSLQGKVRAS